MDFKHLFHGTQDVEKQILDSIRTYQALPLLAANLIANTPEQLLFSKLMKSGPSLHKGSNRPVGSIALGNYITDLMKIPEEHTALIQRFPTKQIFLRLQVEGMLLHSKMYTRSTRR